MTAPRPLKSLIELSSLFCKFKQTEKEIIQKGLASLDYLFCRGTSIHT